MKRPIATFLSTREEARSRLFFSTMKEMLHRDRVCSITAKLNNFPWAKELLDSDDTPVDNELLRRLGIDPDTLDG